MSETGNQNLPVVEAKSEYTKNLKVAISDVIADEINTVYENSVQEAEQKNQVLMTFQKNLKRVLDWSNNHMNMILEKIQKNCSWFNELLTAVIVTNVKILTSVKISKSSKKVQVKMPSPEKFLHQVIIHVARKVYSDPYVVSEKNTKQLYQIIDESVEKTIRDTLPIANILQMYVGDGMDSDEEEEEAEETNDESMMKKKIRKTSKMILLKTPLMKQEMTQNQNTTTMILFQNPNPNPNNHQGSLIHLQVMK